jgi:hypothetical protein
MVPNDSESRGISLVPGFQFWLKSESLGLNGAQPQYAQWVNAEEDDAEKDQIFLANITHLFYPCNQIPFYDKKTRYM